MLKIYFFTLCSFIYVNALPYDCTTNTTIYLEPGEVAFFETPNYPELIYYHTFYKGNFTFVINDSDIMTKKNHFVVFLYHYDFFIVNNASYSVQSLDVGDYYCAVQGYVFVDNSESTCPMELLSKKNPFLFEDETQIIHIHSGFFNSSTSYIRLKPCQWRFAAPHGYGFKIVFTILNLKSELFVINSTTDTIVNHRSIRSNHPYYSNDNYLQIDLLKSDQTNFTKIEFQAYLTIVKNNFDKINGSCATYTDDSETRWFNENIYQNNFRCSFELVIKPFRGVYIDSTIVDLEFNVDIIKYYTNENDVTTLAYGPSTNPIIINTYDNGSEKHVFFDFESDGSVISRGFVIIFDEFVCKCGDSIMFCDGIHTILGYPEDNHVCANLTCRFTIAPCQSELNEFSVSFLNFDINDIIKITSNDETVYSFQVFNLMDNTKYQLAYMYLNPSNNNVLEIQTSLITTAREADFESRRFKAPSKKQYTFSPGDPTLLIEVKRRELMTFEMSEDSFHSIKNATWNIYAVYYCKDKFFNNESLTIPIITDNCNYFPHLSPCQIKRASFAIYNNNDEHFNPEPCLYAITPPGRTKNGCVFDKNNVHYPDSSKPAYIGALATGDGTCVITIINPKHYISNVFTTAYPENVQILSGTSQKELLFEFNSKSGEKWKDIYLFTKAYTVIIPKKAGFFMALEPFSANMSSQDLILFGPSFTILSYEGGYYDIKIDSSVIPYKSIIDTRFFDDICYNTSSSGFRINYYIANNPVMVSIIYRNVHIEIDGKRQLANHQGDSFIFKNQIISLIYYCGEIPINENTFTIKTVIYMQSINETSMMCDTFCCPK